jgi:hypothetical protein
VSGFAVDAIAGGFVALLYPDIEAKRSKFLQKFCPADACNL